MLQSPFNYIPKDKRKFLPSTTTATKTAKRSAGSSNNQIGICSSTPKSSSYRKTLLHTPPPSTHKRFHQQSKKQKTCDSINNNSGQLMSSPTPKRIDDATDDTFTITKSIGSIRSTPTTPPMESRNHRQQVNTPPPTSAKARHYVNETSSRISNHKSSLETKLKLIQLKMENLEESSTKSDITELLQSAIDELSQNEQDLQLPMRKFDEFLSPADPMTPIDQIMYKNGLGLATPPPPQPSIQSMVEDRQYLQMDDHWIPSFAI
ncbi:hypothetical protein CORT_0G02670 [Candida orthopsilosis Co 90-125]|uniref:Uncharacterized protein n=1 Tax=Candida orthopsilosis (strain 90-125) TaxID=1136231 RepID=H8XAU6_CANO9|nr:hypothetical protein CORT_0G02670 [Candida orthopsilosis Co 90-125]CCG24947.1 hypothetical protein CORT_0G02670 [Candida orthopsilosis Co 90-125]